MLGVRTVLAKHKAYKRARRLWEEYLEVSDLQNKVEADQKLSTFLDNFKQSYAELSSGPERETMDSIFGECTDILQSLLAIFEKNLAADGESGFADLLNSALEVAELLIRDEKYRQVVKDTPDLLSQIVDVLSIAGNPEAKKIVLRMISSFGSVSENKMMIGHQGGFQKMLTLLVEGDEDLSREVLKTLKHFLNVEIRQVGDGSDEAAIGVVGGFALFSSENIVHAMSGFTQIAFGEVNRMFPAAKIDERMQLVAANMVDIATEEAALLRESMAFLLEGGEAGLFPPSQASLQHVYDSYEMSQHAAELALATAQADGSDEATPLLSGTEDEVMKELMRMQGVLSTLTVTISDAARTVQLDMMETISRLLLNNPRNQQEFRTADGYTRFLKLFDRVTDYSAQDNMVFLQDVFDTLFTIALDGNPERVVGNTDAMRLLVDLVCTASSVVQIHAVRTLNDLLTVNYVNAAVLQTIDGDTSLINLLLGEKARADDVAAAAPASSATGSAAASASASDQVRPEVVEPLVKLLEYTIFLLSSHSLRPLGYAVRSLAIAQSSAVPLPIFVEEAVLKMVSNIICDLRARRAPFNVIQMLQTIIEMTRHSFAAATQPVVADTATIVLTREARIILLLEIMGVLVHDSPSFVSIVVEAQGLTLLTSIICDKTAEVPGSSVPRRPRTDKGLAVRHAALWILQDIVGASCRGGMDHTEWLVSLLNAQLPLELHLLVFAAVREVGLSSTVKRLLRSAGALDTLVEFLRSGDVMLVAPVLKTLSVLVRDSEENKSYVTEELLNGDYSLLVHTFRSVPYVVTLANFRIALELACIGPVHAILHTRHDEDPLEERHQQGPPAIGTTGDDGGDRLAGNDSADDDELDGHGQSAGDTAAAVPPPDSDERTVDGREGGVEDAGSREDPEWQDPDAMESGGPWENAIREHVQRFRDPQILFLQGPPSLSRHYAFLIALQKRREQTSDDDDTGSLSPRSQMTSELRESDVLSQLSDSASESSSIRDSVDLATRDLALQALLNEQAVAKQKEDGSRPSRWWELGRRKDRVEGDEPEPEPESVPRGVKVRVDSQTDGLYPDQVAGRRLGRQIITSLLKFDLQDTGAGTGGVPFWRPGSGWAVNSTKPASSLVDSGTRLTPKVMVRGPTALSLLLEVVLLGDEAVQGAMIASLLRIAASGLAARRSMCHAGGLQRCLSLSLDPRLSQSESVQRLVHVLASALGRYDLSLVELRELFLMAYGAQSARQQVRLLQVIAAIAQRWEPVALIQLSGPVSAATAPALDKFPKQQTGYTICAWVKLRATLEPGENLVFCWKDSKYLIFELFFRVWPRERLEDGTLEPYPRRNLCVRMRNSPCTHTEYFTYDEFSFDRVDSWHHMVLTHNKQLLSLYVDGRYVQSFQPLNYPIGISKTYPLHAVIGCPQDSETNTHTAFLERCTGTFCGELGLLHVTEGVWDASSAEAAAKSFPYQRNLQAIGVNYKQLLCMDPLAYPSLPFANDQRIRGGGQEAVDMAAPGTGTPDMAMQSEDLALPAVGDDSASVEQTTRLAELESWRELQREKTREKEQEIERWRDDRPVVFSHDAAHDPFGALAATSGVASGAADTSRVASEPSPAPQAKLQPTGGGDMDEAPEVALPSQFGADSRSDFDAPAIGGGIAPAALGRSGISSDRVEASPVDDMLEEIRKAVAPLGIQGDVDIHHMGSLHEVAHEVGDFYLPLPFLMMAPPQRALGLRVLLEMLYANEQTVKAFRDAKAGSTILYLLQGWSADGEADPAFDSLFELLREEALPVGECMRLIIDLMLIDTLPMQTNLCHLQTLSDLLLGDSGPNDELEAQLDGGARMAQQWKEKGGGMTAMMEVLSRSSGEQTRVVLDIVRLIWKPTFTTEDLDMMLEFCVGTVEEMLSILEESDDDGADGDEQHMLDEDHALLDGGVLDETGGVDHNSIVLLHATSDVDGADIQAPSVLGMDEQEDMQAAVQVQYYSDSDGGGDDGDDDDDMGSADMPKPVQPPSYGTLYGYGYDSDDEFEADNGEIDAQVAHGLGIADCDFHDWLGDEIPEGEIDGGYKAVQEPTDTDYAAQISEAKVEALIFVRELLVAKPPDVAVDLMRGAGGFQILFALLSSPDERIRLLALDLLGLLVCHGKPADAKAFVLAGGFDTVAKYLVRHWISRPVGWALLCLAVRTTSTTVDTAEWLEGRSHLSDPTSPRGGGPATPASSGRSASDRSDDEGAPLVVNFEALYCLLQLLQFGTTDKPVEREMSERLAEIVMAPHNLDQLLTHNFGDWCFAFFAKIQRHAVARRGVRNKSHVFQVVRRINGALLLLNIPRALPPKTFKALRKSISDAADFGIYLVEDVLDHYELSPVLSADDASNTVKNLASFFDQIEEHTDIPVETCVCIVALINNMAVRNNSTSRNHMMTHKLLDTRDHLVLHCLKCDSSVEACYELVAMPFESVIEQPSFREKNGPLYLLRHMHRASCDPSLQVLFATVIKHMCTVEENRKVVARVIDDVDISTRMLGNYSGENVNQWLRILPPRTGPVPGSPEGHGDSLAVSGGYPLISDDRSPMRIGGAVGPAADASAAASSNAAASSGGGAAPRFHAVSPVRTRPVSPTSSIGSATSAGEAEYMQDSTMADCEEFLEWYHSPGQDEKREGIEARLEKLLGPADKTWRRLHERQLAARSKAFRSRVELARAKESALLDSFNEEDKKVRARVEKMGTNHLRRVQLCIVERRARAREVSISITLWFSQSFSLLYRSFARADHSLQWSCSCRVGRHGNLWWRELI